MRRLARLSVGRAIGSFEGNVKMDPGLRRDDEHSVCFAPCAAGQSPGVPGSRGCPGNELPRSQPLAVAAAERV
jgi:hypothetical protein